MKANYLIATCLLAQFSLNAVAGKLDDFEADVTGQPSPPSSSGSGSQAGSSGQGSSPSSSDGRYYHDHYYNDDYYDNRYYRGRRYLEVDSYGGRGTDHRDEREKQSWPEFRSRKDSLLSPNFRLDLGIGDIDNTLDLSEHQIEAGSGSFSLSYRSTKLEEHGPLNITDSLRFISTLVNYRHRIGDFAVDFGIGRFNWKGNNRFTENAWSLAARWHHDRKFVLEYRYLDVLGSDLSFDDQEINVLLGSDQISLRLGYRSFGGRTMDLNGPQAGIVMHF